MELTILLLKRQSHDCFTEKNLKYNVKSGVKYRPLYFFLNDALNYFDENKQRYGKSTGTSRRGSKGLKFRVQIFATCIVYYIYASNESLVAVI